MKIEDILSKKETEDILSEKETEEYHKEWELFTEKFVPETEYHTHSGKPVIGKVFRFNESPIFRSRIVSKSKLKSIDPYFIFKKYTYPFWHLLHYLIVFEQMYHASMCLIRDTDKFRTLETPREFKLSNPVFWNEDISVELIWQPRRETRKYMIEDCFLALYDDKSNEVKNKFSARTFVEQRPYIASIEKIEKGRKLTLSMSAGSNKDEQKKLVCEEIELLIEMIESRMISQGNLIKPKKDLQRSKDRLITMLREGRVPQNKIINFFSFWDK